MFRWVLPCRFVWKTHQKRDVGWYSTTLGSYPVSRRSGVCRRDLVSAPPESSPTAMQPQHHVPGLRLEGVDGGGHIASRLYQPLKWIAVVFVERESHAHHTRKAISGRMRTARSDLGDSFGQLVHHADFFSVGKAAGLPDGAKGVSVSAFPAFEPPVAQFPCPVKLAVRAISFHVCQPCYRSSKSCMDTVTSFIHF